MLVGAENGTASLWTALLAVQGELPKIVKDATAKIDSRREGAQSFTYKFASLEGVNEEVVPILTRHDLVWTTKPCRDEQGDPALAYKLVHAPTGDAEGGVMPLMLMAKDPKGHGSAITYARRYALLAVLNIATTDDDGGAAGRAEGRVVRSNGRASSANGRQVTAATPQPTERIATASQRGLINKKANGKRLPPIVVANILLAAADQPRREFEGQSHAEAFVNRQMDRLPARLVDGVLEGIDAAAAEVSA